MPIRLSDEVADLAAWSPDECSLLVALDVVGTRTAVLLLREAYYGATRFDLFAKRIGATDAAVAARLRQLTDDGLFERRPYRERGSRTRHEYLLTEKGRALFPVVMGLIAWGDRYRTDHEPWTEHVDTETGRPVHAAVVDDEGREVPMERVRLEARPQPPAAVATSATTSSTV